MAKPNPSKGWQPPQWFWALIALLAILAYNALFTPVFFHLETKQGHLYGSLVDVLQRGSPVMLIALGMTLVIALGGVDLSVGAVMAVAGAIAAQLVTHNQPFPLAVALAVGVATLLGLWNGSLVVFAGVQPIVATLILLVSGRGIAQLITDGQIITFSSTGLAWLGGGYYFGLPIAIWLVALCGVVVWLATRQTTVGLMVEASGDNPIAARYTGIPTKSIGLFAYGLTGLLAGLAGLVVTGNVHAADANEVGLYIELDAILTVVIGGTPLTGGRFSLLGSILGALVIQTLTTTILTKGIPTEFTLVVKAVIVLAVCLLQSRAARARLLAPFRRRPA
jgi:simple sugar transport system permease protein